MKFRSRRNAINSQSEFSSPLRGEFAVPRYFKQLPKSNRAQTSSNFPGVNLRFRSFASFLHHQREGEGEGSHESEQSLIPSELENERLCIISRNVPSPSTSLSRTRYVRGIVLCIFPRITAYDPINHPAWIFGAEIYDVSPLSAQALCKLFSSRHLPSRGDLPSPLRLGLLPSIQFPSFSVLLRGVAPETGLSNYCQVTTRSLFYYTLWIITSLSSLRIIYRGQRCGGILRVNLSTGVLL